MLCRRALLEHALQQDTERLQEQLPGLRDAVVKLEREYMVANGIGEAN